MSIEPLNVRVSTGTEGDTTKSDTARRQSSAERLQISVSEEMFVPVDGLVRGIADGNRGLIRTTMDRTDGPKLCEAIGYLPEDYQNALAAHLREIWNGAEPGSLGDIIKKLYAILGSGAVLALTALVEEMKQKEFPPDARKLRKSGDGDSDLDIYV